MVALDPFNTVHDFGQESILFALAEGTATPTARFPGSDQTRESHPTCFGQAFVQTRCGSEFPQQSDFSNKRRIGTDGNRCQTAHQSQSDGQITALPIVATVQAQLSNHIHVHIHPCQIKTTPFLQYSQQQIQSCVRDTVNGATSVPGFGMIVGRCYQCLYFHCYCTHPFQCNRCGTPFHIFVIGPICQKQGRWIRNRQQPSRCHFVNAHFFRRSKTILTGAKDSDGTTAASTSTSIAATAVCTFQIQHTIDHMFDGARSSHITRFRDMSNQHHTNPSGFGQSQQQTNAFPNLGNPTRRRCPTRSTYHRLEGINDNQ